MLTKPHIKERLSLAYIHAIAGRAGIGITNPRLHDYGVDGSMQEIVRQPEGYVESGFPVDFQLKSTVVWEHDQDAVIYDLEARTYNTLVGRPRGAVPLVLFLLCLPRDEEQWLAATETEIILRHCCYWYWPVGPRTENESSKRVQIPRSNVLDVESLRQIMQSVRPRRRRS